MRRLLVVVFLFCFVLPVAGQVIIRRVAGGCATCTTDWYSVSATDGDDGHGTNVGAADTDETCWLGKLIMVEAACAATSTDITFYGRNFDASAQRARLVVYSDDGNGGTPGSGYPDALLYTGGCFYQSGAGGSDTFSDGSLRTASTCTADGDGDVYGTYAFDCSDAPDDVFWVGFCAEEHTTRHFLNTTAGAAADDMNLKSDAVDGYFESPPDPFPASQTIVTGIHNVGVLW